MWHELLGAAIEATRKEKPPTEDEQSDQLLASFCVLIGVPTAVCTTYAILQILGEDGLGVGLISLMSGLPGLVGGFLGFWIGTMISRKMQRNWKRLSTILLSTIVIAACSSPLFLSIVKRVVASNFQ